MHWNFGLKRGTTLSHLVFLFLQHFSLSKAMVSFETLCTFAKVTEEITEFDVLDIVTKAKEFESISLKPSEKVPIRGRLLFSS